MAQQQSLNELPVGELIQRMSQQTASLVRQELQLAQIEMKEKGKRAGLGAGMFGGAGVFALYGVGALIATLVLVLATFLEPWVAAAIVTVVLFAIAGVLALTGKKEIEQATPPAPEQAIESTKQDVDELKGRAARA
jgi:uncharacterized membrane protein YqjE